ncbi:MAG: MgtC/SapB family protein [Polyangiales bacterium]
MDLGPFDELRDLALWSRVGMAMLCGGLVGLERQLRGKPAGMRTSSLICLGTTMFVYLGIGISDAGHGDATRVLGQVVTGVGFLGAGVIMTRNGLVTGVTSAAVVWVLAAIGAMIGAGRYAAALAVSIVTVVVLVGVELLERVFSSLRRGVHANMALLRADDEGDDDGDGESRRPRSSGAPPWKNR